MCKIKLFSKISYINIDNLIKEYIPLSFNKNLNKNNDNCLISLERRKELELENTEFDYGHNIKH